jgi:prophage DNA circulation protein
MQQSDIKEAAGILRTLLAQIGTVASDRTGNAAGALNQAVGALSAAAEASISGLTFGSQLVAIFALLRTAGASFTGVDAVRAQALATMPISAVAGVVADAVMLQALVCECRIVADIIFDSRDQVDAYRDTLDAGFDVAIDKASDNFDQVSFQALVSLRAALVRDLSDRARPLPQMINYAFPTRRSALWMAQRLYGDGSRYLELIAENNVVHPLFMPAAGRALSR